MVVCCRAEDGANAERDRQALQATASGKHNRARWQNSARPFRASLLRPAKSPGTPTGQQPHACRHYALAPLLAAQHAGNHGDNYVRRWRKHRESDTRLQQAQLLLQLSTHEGRRRTQR